MTAWMPGALVHRAHKDGGSMLGEGDERVLTWHYYVCPTSMDPWAGAKYLNKTGNTVHLLFNVLTGKTVQMIPANRAGRGLKNRAGGPQTNRRGTINLQIEVMANSPHWWRELTPAGLQGLANIMAYARSLGIPDQWAGQPGNGGDTPNGRSGHTGHHNWVENDHHDHLSKAPWELVAGLDRAPAVKVTDLAGLIVAPIVVPKDGGAPPWPLPSTHRIGRNPRRHVTWHDGLGTDKAGRAAIKTWQQQMLNRGWPALKGGVDGKFGATTEKVARQFQSEKGLPVTGYIDPQTWEQAWTAPTT